MDTGNTTARSRAGAFNNLLLLMPQFRPGDKDWDWLRFTHSHWPKFNVFHCTPTNQPMVFSHLFSWRACNRQPNFFPLRGLCKAVRLPHRTVPAPGAFGPRLFFLPPWGVDVRLRALRAHRPGWLSQGALCREWHDHFRSESPKTKLGDQQ